MKRIVALLPMKANSERVKGKNFKNFHGKPLFKWVLDTLLSLEKIDQIVINTDARKILEEQDLRESERLLIRDRRPEICGDMVSMNRVIEDDINAVPAETYLMTHTTNPLISAETFAHAIQKYKDSLDLGFDSLFSVNVFRSRFYHPDLRPVNHDPNVLVRTQDLNPLLEENSCIYIFNKDSFKKTDARIGSKPTTCETPPSESIDIDDQDTWKKAEIFYSINS